MRASDALPSRTLYPRSSSAICRTLWPVLKAQASAVQPRKSRESATLLDSLPINGLSNLPWPFVSPRPVGILQPDCNGP
ncbi:hypothetical protein CEP54_010995 [Fusarium duplospermum]|uniref:Uncharacterized protein n=1 Tax=Fusarium duplospermum TaxID=1325734 RepID=A0A428PGZ0_9HYPO|nr:hypothetical protein CEP54_010995 [Fusarium duplospermum]